MPRAERGGYAVIYRVIHCPECRSKRTRVARTIRPQPGRPRIRYHKCLDCGTNFKSVEKAD